MHADGERPRRSLRPARQLGRSTRLGLRLAAVALVLAAAVALVVAYRDRQPPRSRAAISNVHVHRAGGVRTTAAPSTTTTAGDSTTITAAPSTTTTAAPSTTITAGAGTLPQTTTLPSATSSQFHGEMAALWNGVVRDKVSLAMPAFFPLGAYLQLKTISDPRADWQVRLVGEFALDVAAAHALIGSGATSAVLIGVDVPATYAHWVTPGVCDNSVGYYEVPNARIVYRVDGVIRSFGIASMISWRGQWYVVHLGSVLRTTTGQGEVDDPATGPGTSAYSSTC
jgi:hypothetical protein